MDLLLHYLSYLQSGKSDLLSRKKRNLLDKDSKTPNNSDASPKEKVTKRAYRLKSRCRGIYFTNLEAKCIKLLLKSKTIIEITAILNLSQNTIKDYIKRIKTKIGYHNKSRLIECLHANRITRKNKFLNL